LPLVTFYNVTNDILNILIFYSQFNFSINLVAFFCRVYIYIYIYTCVYKCVYKYLNDVFRNNYCQYTVLQCYHQKLNPIVESFIEHETVAINKKKVNNNSGKFYFIKKVSFLKFVNQEVIKFSN